MHRATRKLLAAATTGLLIHSVAALAFPTKPITVIVPFSPGTSTDVLSREFGKSLAEVTGQPVVINNKVGAEGAIGAQALLGAPADGHTLMVTSSSLAVLDPLLKKSLPYNPTEDLLPICALVRVDNTANMAASLPFKTLAEFVAAAKAQPGKYTYAYSSATTHVAGEIFAQAAGVKLLGVAYKSSATGLTDVAAGRVDLFLIDHVSSAPYRDSGKIRAIAVSGSERLKDMPDVPSAKEAGIPDYVIEPFFAVYAAKNTPPAVVRQLREIVAKANKAPAMQSSSEKRGMLPMDLCGDALRDLHAAESAKMQKAIERAGIEKE